MSDNSLMNPDHLKQEMLATIELIEKTERDAKETLARIEKIIDYVSDTHNAGESTTLSHAKVSELLGLLGSWQRELYVPAHHDKFYLRVCRNLLKDRRWFIASRLTFLKK